jgi:hypothetical protein
MIKYENCSPKDGEPRLNTSPSTPPSSSKKKKKSESTSASSTTVTDDNELNAHNSGSRTLLRLHRALVFICQFLERLKFADHKVSSHKIGVESYESTLAKHHGWIIRKTVVFGMRALPKRETLIGYMCKTPEHHERFVPFIKNVEEVYNITQNIYSKYNLLNLP